MFIERPSVVYYYIASWLTALLHSCIVHAGLMLSPPYLVLIRTYISPFTLTPPPASYHSWLLEVPYSQPPPLGLTALPGIIGVKEMQRERVIRRGEERNG